LHLVIIFKTSQTRFNVISFAVETRCFRSFFPASPECEKCEQYRQRIDTAV